MSRCAPPTRPAAPLPPFASPHRSDWRHPTIGTITTASLTIVKAIITATGCRCHSCGHRSHGLPCGYDHGCECEQRGCERDDTFTNPRGYTYRCPCVCPNDTAREPNRGSAIPTGANTGSAIAIRASTHTTNTATNTTTNTMVRVTMLAHLLQMLHHHGTTHCRYW